MLDSRQSLSAFVAFGTSDEPPSWVRPTRHVAKIQARAESLVTKSLVTNEVTTETKGSEKQIIEFKRAGLIMALWVKARAAFWTRLLRPDPDSQDPCVACTASGESLSSASRSRHDAPGSTDWPDRSERLSGLRGRAGSA